MGMWKSDNSALRFQLDKSISKIHLDGKVYDNGSVTGPLNVDLEFVTFDNDGHEYPLVSNAVWAKETTLILAGLYTLSGQKVVYVIPEVQLQYNPSHEHFTDADGEGVKPEDRPEHMEDAKNMLFHNWRCGPKTIPQDMLVFNVLLKDYSRFGGMKPADFVNTFYNGDNAKWPDNDGFVSLDSVKSGEVPVKTLIDRFGKEDTEYFGIFGMTFAQRSLTPSSLGFLARPGVDKFSNTGYIEDCDHDMYRVYEVKKPFGAKMGPVAPCFTQPGRGIQIIADKTDNDKTTPKMLVDGGFLTRLSWKEIENLYTKIAKEVESHETAMGPHSAVTVSTINVLAEAGYGLPAYCLDSL